MLLTLDVSNFDKFNDIRDEQPWNMWLMDVAFEVSRASMLIEVDWNSH